MWTGPVEEDRYRGAVTTTDPTTERAHARCVALVGPMGAGKSTIAVELARRTGRRLVDLDAEIEATTGRSIAELVASDGEAAFRAQERTALAAALDGDEPVVLATGGGAVLDPDSRRLLADAATVVWLTAPADVLVSRIGDVSSRPLLAGTDPAATLARLIGERDALYAEVADLRVDVAERTPAEVVDLILEQTEVTA